MGNKNKKKKKKSPYAAGGLPEPVGEKRKVNWRNVIMLVGNTIIIFGGYRFALNTEYFLYIMWAYYAAVAALSLAYVIYNRGFSRGKITMDMLPDTMSFEEKLAFLDDAAERKRKSKWMLTLLFPFVFTLLFEVLELYTWDYIKSLIGG